MNYLINDNNGKPRKVKIEVETITPEMAQKYLANNYENNRKLALERVAGYARDMASHEWEFTGQTIVFDQNGRLIDGQHRLEAISKSGEEIQMIVVRGVSPKAVLYIDKNRARSMADTMRIENNGTILRNPSTVSMIRKLAKYETAFRSLTESDVKWLFNCFQNECAIVHEALPKVSVRPYTSDFRAACLAATIAGVPEEELREYLEVFRYRTPVPDYNSDAALRWEATLHKYGSAKGSRVDCREYYSGTLNSLHYFLTNKKYVVHNTPKDWFPIKDKLLSAIQGRYE